MASLAMDTPPRRLKVSHVLAVAAGNGLEFFDFLLYSTFAIYIGKTYVPSHNPTVSLLLSLATFGIGFVTRPIGGLVLGRLGDRLGRTRAMMISFMLAAVGVFGIAVTPGYAQIGIAAPVIVIVARLIQGFALGGEVGPSTAYMVEAAPENRRGFFGGMQSGSQGVAFMAASLVALILSMTLSAAALQNWGWRIGFVIGLSIVPFGILVRRSLPESAPHLTLPGSEPVREPVPWKLVVLGLMLLTNGTISTYVGSYMTTYAMDTLHMGAQGAFGAGVINGVCTLVFVPLGGWLSDLFGRRLLLFGGLLVSAAATIPAFVMVIAHPTPLILDLAVAAIAIPSSLGGAAILTALTESFPPRMRSLSVGLVYAVAISIFGGTTQLVIAWLIHTTGQPLAPAYYRVAASAIGLLAICFLPESAPIRLQKTELAAVPAESYKAA